MSRARMERRAAMKFNEPRRKRRLKYGQTMYQHACCGGYVIFRREEYVSALRPFLERAFARSHSARCPLKPPCQDSADTP